MRILGILILAAGAAVAQQAPQPAPRVAPGSSSVNTADGLRSIADIEAKLAELRKQYTESFPPIRDLKAQLERLRVQAGLTSELQGTRVTSQPKLAQPSLGGLPDNWWRNAGMVSLLRLTPAQVKQMEDNFQQHRLRLIDLNASLEKEEVTLEPLVAADTLDETKLLAQIDRVAQARAELEKYRGRMLLGIRKVLESEQWRKLNEMGFSVNSR
jgi:Spy/CpxP family protein refolding chaperone